MQTPLQIAFQNLDASEAVKGLIEEKVAWLERYYDRITGCRVVIQSPHRHHRQGNLYQVRIDLSVPGGEIVVNRESPPHADSDLAVVVRDAFDAARRQLEEHGRRLRREVKNHEPPPHARVGKLFPEAGYGFLDTPDGREVYFHRNAVFNGGFEHLEVGTEVSFVEVPGDKGPQATTIRPVGRHNHH
jgi:ribosomal subunit interface protein